MATTDTWGVLQQSRHQLGQLRYSYVFIPHRHWRGESDSYSYFEAQKGSHVSSITSVLVAPTPPLSLPWSSKGTLANKNAVSIKPNIHPKIPHREQCGHCWVSNQGVKRLTDQTAAGHFGRDFFIHGLKHSFSKVLLSNIIERVKGSWVFLSLDPTL